MQPACELPTAGKSNSAPFATARLLLFVLLAAFGIGLAWTASQRSAGVDFYQFWVGGQILAQPQHASLYSDDGRASLGAEFLQRARASSSPRQKAVAEYRQKLETYSSPLLYSFFKWGSTGDYDRDLDRYRLLLIASLVFSVIAFARLLQLPWDLTFGAIAIFTAWFGPFASELQVGNVNSLQLASLALYAWLRFRWHWKYHDVVAGAVLALSVAFKPNLVFLLVALAVAWGARREFRRVIVQHAIGGLLGGALAIVVGFLGSHEAHCWTDWIAAVRALPPDIIPVEYGNYALARLLNEVWGSNAMMVGLVFCPVLSILALWRSKSAFTDDLRALALGCLWIVLVPPLAWLHYYVLVIPVILLLLRSAASCSCHVHASLRFVLLGIALFGYGFANLGINVSRLAQGSAVVGATVILFALTLERILKTPATP